MHVRFTGPSAWTAVLLALVCGSAPADAQTVVARQRLGNNTEGITSFSRGNGRDVAVIDGYDVFNVRLPGVNSGQRGRPCDPIKGTSGRTCRRLFNVRSLSGGSLHGIAYVQSQDRFYFAGNDATRLYATDVNGGALPPLAIAHKSDPGSISQWEGLAYIPPDSSMFPDTIAGITIGKNLIGHIQIIGLDGAVLREIVFPAGSPLFDYLGGVAFKAPDRLLVTPAAGPVIYEITFDGDIVGEAHPVADAGSAFEGLTMLEDGRVVTAEYGNGHLYVLDSTFERRRGNDRDFVVGFGISTSKLAWNPDTREFLVNTRGPFGEIRAARVFAVSSDLATFRFVVDFAGTRFAPSPVLGIGYLAGENRLAITTTGAGIRGIAVFDTTTGAFVPPRIALEGTFPLARDVTSLPPFCLGCLGVRVIGRDPVTRATRTEIRVITRTGSPHPTDPDAIVPVQLPPIVLSSEPTDGGLAFDNSPAGGRILAGLAAYDLAGNLLETISKEALGVNFVSAIVPITNGDHQGRYAVIDAASSELVVFSLP